jgi:hypothetical protein
MKKTRLQLEEQLLMMNVLYVYEMAEMMTRLKLLQKLDQNLKIEI